MPVALEELPTHRVLDADAELPEWEEWRKEQWRTSRDMWTPEQRETLKKMAETYFICQTVWEDGKMVDRFEGGKWSESFVEDLEDAIITAKEEAMATETEAMRTAMRPKVPAKKPRPQNARDVSASTTDLTPGRAEAPAEVPPLMVRRK